MCKSMGAWLLGRVHREKWLHRLAVDSRSAAPVIPPATCIFGSSVLRRSTTGQAVEYRDGGSRIPEVSQQCAYSDIQW